MDSMPCVGEIIQMLWGKEGYGKLSEKRNAGGSAPCMILSPQAHGGDDIFCNEIRTGAISRLYASCT